MAVRKTNSDAAAEIEADEAMKKRAARQALAKEKAAQTLPDVTVRVLKAGDGKISMGQHVPGVGEAHYERGEKFTVRQDIALDLEDRGYVEIEDKIDRPDRDTAGEPDPE